MKYWDPTWDDEDWLMRQSAATLRYIWTEAGARTDKDRIKVLIGQKLNENLFNIHEERSWENERKLSDADILAHTQQMKDTENGSNRTLYIGYRKNLMSTIVKRMQSYIDKDKLDTYSGSWKYLMLGRAADLMGGLEDTELQSQYDKEKLGLGGYIKSLQKSDEQLGLETVETLVAADRLGVFEDVNQDLMNALCARAGLCVQTSPHTNSVLDAVVNSTDVRDESGNLNEIYSECERLADSVEYDLPDGIEADRAAELKQLYNDQLMADAAQRAAQDILRDVRFLTNNTTDEEVKNAYKKKVAENFQRSVVLAGLAGSKDVTVALNEIVINDSGDVVYTGDADIVGIIDGIKSGTVKINPSAVQIDKYMLDEETEAFAKEKKARRIKTELTFWEKAKGAVAKAWENAKKHKAWTATKVLANIGVFMAAGGLMAANAPAAVITGATLYAVWTGASAWLMPAADKAIKEGKKFGVAFAEKKAEPDFVKRALWRTGEGLAIGGVTGGLSHAGDWLKTISRQGLMVAGKGGSLIRSNLKLKSAKQDLKAGYTLQNFNKLQTAAGYVKQDETSLLAVIAGSAIADVVKLGISSNSGNTAQTTVEDTIPASNGGNTATVADTAGVRGGNTATVADTIRGGNTTVADTIRGGNTTTVADTTAVRGGNTATVADTTAVRGGNTTTVADTTAVRGGDNTEVSNEASASNRGSSATADEGKGATSNQGKGLNQRSDGRYYDDYKLDDNGPYTTKGLNYDDYNNLEPYSKDMGITQRSYNTLVRVYGAKELDRMLGILDKDGVMDHFKHLGLTKEQLLVRYRALDAYTDRVGRDGFSIQGATRFHHEDAMTALNKLLGRNNCDGSLSNADYANINKSLSVVDNYGRYFGAGKVPTTSYLYRAHGPNVDCPEGQLNEFRPGHRIPDNTTEPKVMETVVETNHEPITETVTQKVSVHVTENREAIQVSENHAGTIHFNTAKAGLGARDGVPADQITNIKPIEGQEDAYSFTNKHGEGSIKVKGHYNEGKGEHVRLWLKGDFDTDHGFTGKGKQVNMLAEDFDRLIKGEALEYETPATPVTEEQYAELVKPETPITYDSSASSKGNMDEFDVQNVEGVDNLKLPKPVRFDMETLAESVTLEKPSGTSQWYVLRMEDVAGEQVSMRFNAQGNCVITNADGNSTYVDLDQQATFNQIAHDIVAANPQKVLDAEANKITKTVVDATFNTGMPEGSLTAKCAQIAAESRQLVAQAANTQVVNQVVINALGGGHNRT